MRSTRINADDRADRVNEVHAHASPHPSRCPPALTNAITRVTSRRSDSPKDPIRRRRGENQRERRAHETSGQALPPRREASRESGGHEPLQGVKPAQQRPRRGTATPTENRWFEHEPEPIDGWSENRKRQTPRCGPARTRNRNRTRECGRPRQHVTEEHTMNDADRHDQIEALTELKRLWTTRTPTETTSGTRRSEPSTDSTRASRPTTGGGRTADGDHRTPRRGPRPTSSERPGSNATPSTGAPCGAVSETPSRRSRSRKRPPKTETQQLKTRKTTRRKCPESRAPGASISTTTGHGPYWPRPPDRSPTPKWPALDGSRSCSRNTPRASPDSDPSPRRRAPPQAHKSRIRTEIRRALRAHATADRTRPTIRRSQARSTTRPKRGRETGP